MEWEQIARAHIHPLRLAVLDAFDTARGPTSAVRVAEERGEPLGRVAHHVRQLARLGLIVPAGTRPRRGAVEHFYRATACPRA
jgi:hypothetical protein